MKEFILGFDGCAAYAHQDDEIAGIFETQQNRRRLEEQNKKNAQLMKQRKAAERVALRKRVHYTFLMGSRVCMFFAGVCAAVAVSFFDGWASILLVLFTLTTFGFTKLSKYCDWRSRRKRRRSKAV